MKTNSVLRALAITVFAVIFSNSVLAQFIGTTINNQTPIVEERKGGTTTYSVPGPDTNEYTWQVTGGTIVSPSGATGAGTVANPYVIPFTVGLTSIQVAWPDDGDAIGSQDVNVGVQERVPSGTLTCPSAIQSWDVRLWSEATATIATAGFEICSGDAVGGSINIDFTGAPNFDYTYTVTNLDGTTAPAQVITGITGSSTTILLPDNLLNTSSTDDQYYVITLTQMNDGFTGNGSIINATFTITVHPTVVTGPISSSRALTRR